MSQIDETTVDVEDVIRRIQAVRRGELPQDAVTTEELRKAVEAQRRRYASGGTPSSDAKQAETKRVSTKKQLIIPDLGDL